MDVKTAQCYSEKLQTADLTVDDDSYLERNSHRLRDDIKIWHTKENQENTNKKIHFVTILATECT